MIENLTFIPTQPSLSFKGFYVSEDSLLFAGTFTLSSNFDYPIVEGEEVCFHSFLCQSLFLFYIIIV